MVDKRLFHVSMIIPERSLYDTLAILGAQRVMNVEVRPVDELPLVSSGQRIAPAPLPAGDTEPDDERPARSRAKPSKAATRAKPATKKANGRGRAPSTTRLDLQQAAIATIRKRGPRTAGELRTLMNVSAGETQPLYQALYTAVQEGLLNKIDPTPGGQYMRYDLPRQRGGRKPPRAKAGKKPRASKSDEAASSVNITGAGTRSTSTNGLTHKDAILAIMDKAGGEPVARTALIAEFEAQGRKPSVVDPTLADLRRKNAIKTADEAAGSYVRVA